MACTRVRWQDLYGIERHLESDLAVHVATSPTFDPTTKIGVQGTGVVIDNNGKFGLPLTDHPNMKAPSGTIESEQARGIAQRHKLEYNTAQTGEPPEVVMPSLADAYLLSTWVHSLFQGGTSEAVGVANIGLNILTAVPYLSACPEMYLHIVRVMQEVAGTDPVDQVLKGGVCSQLQISGEMGGMIEVEATVKGALWQNLDLSTLQSNIDFIDDVTPFKFQDMGVAIYDPDTTAWVPVQIPGFSITMSNEVMFNYYNDPAAASAHLDRLAVNGSITIPWGANVVGKNYMIERFLGGETRKIAFYWGTTAVPAAATDYLLDVDRLKTGTTDTKSYFSMLLNARISDYDMVGDNEHQVEATFEGVYDYDTVGDVPINAIEVRCAYDNTRLDSK